MTQVVYGQKGYLGSSMSVRAAEAYEQGEMPISRWTKTAIIQAVKDYCFDFDLAYDPDIENNTKAELVKEFLRVFFRVELPGLRRIRPLYRFLFRCWFNPKYRKTIHHCCLLHSSYR